MQVTVHSSDFFLSEALRSQSEERVRAAMSCYESLVQQIVMWQSGTNGPYRHAKAFYMEWLQQLYHARP